MNLKGSFNRIIYHFVAFYGVSKSEAIGFTVLIPILFIVISTPLWFKYVFPVNNEIDEKYLVEFKEWVAESEASIVKDHPEIKSPEIAKKIRYHDFDPNLASSEELTKLGFKPWIAERIVKYRKSGGRFESVDDLSKIYGIDMDHLKKLSNYVKIDAAEYTLVSGVEDEARDYPKKRIRPKIEPKNLNTAIEVDFAKVRGIGPVLSERIVKYREMLGGFSKLDQLNEVYGLDQSIADSAKTYFYLDTVKVEKLDVNHLKKEEMRKHPYISYKLANSIEEYRIQHGDYTEPEDLLQIKILDDSTFQKILPYLKID